MSVFGTNEVQDNPAAYNNDSTSKHRFLHTDLVAVCSCDQHFRRLDDDENVEIVDMFNDKI